jgi:L-ascorbate metabolism protein UlaG (beta-lactamase superfamily)
MLLTFVGHSTALIEIDGVRVLTDPVLRRRVLHLERRATPPRVSELSHVDLVLVSHLHADHFDPRSLRKLDRAATLVVPGESGPLATKLGFSAVVELSAGETASLAGLQIGATHADHRPGRWPGGSSEAIGFTVAGERERAYFAGDTDVFDGMRDLAGDLDLALLPVWGWGTQIGAGHLDPSRAVEALKLLQPRVAVPIHWGTLYPIGLRRFRRQILTEPPRAFARLAAERAPDVDVRVLEPGASTAI